MSYAESISKFMEWAEAKIAQAVKDDEAFEKEAGTRDFVPQRRKMICPHGISDEEKIQIVLQAQEYRRQGHKAPYAAKLAGCHQSTYNKWARDFNLPYQKTPSL